MAHGTCSVTRGGGWGEDGSITYSEWGGAQTVRSDFPSFAFILAVIDLKITSCEDFMISPLPFTLL